MTISTFILSFSLKSEDEAKMFQYSHPLFVSPGNYPIFWGYKGISSIWIHMCVYKNPTHTPTYTCICTVMIILCINLTISGINWTEAARYICDWFFLIKYLKWKDYLKSRLQLLVTIIYTTWKKEALQSLPACPPYPRQAHFFTGTSSRFQSKEEQQRHPAS